MCDKHATRKVLETIGVDVVDRLLLSTRVFRLTYRDDPVAFVHEGSRVSSPRNRSSCGQRRDLVERHPLVLAESVQRSQGRRAWLEAANR